MTRVENNPEGNSEIIPLKLPDSQLEKFKISVADLPYSDLKILLTGFINNCGEELEKLQSCIETWFNEYMNRASGWYKIIVQKKLFVLSLILAVSINIDFFKISNTLLTDKELTKEIAIAAEKYKPHTEADSKEDWAKAIIAKKALVDTLYAINAPIGWHKDSYKEAKDHWKLKIAGWLISALLLAFGAPFWFDLLGKLINIRKAGIKPTSS